jgi:hypothetical protein
MTGKALRGSGISLDNIKYHPHASRHSSSFDATLKFNGDAICKVSNDGRGGSDVYTPIKGQTSAQMREALMRVRRHIAALPSSGPTGAPDQTLQTITAAALAWHLALLDLRRQTKSGCLYRKPGSKAIHYRSGKGPSSVQEAIRIVRNQFPDATILNELDEATACAMMLGQG